MSDVVLHLLNRAVQTNSLVEASDNLKEVERILSGSSEGDIIKQSTLLSIKELIKKFGYQIIIQVAYLYKTLTELPIELKPNILFNLYTDIFVLAKELNGTDIGYKLNTICIKGLNDLVSKNSFSKDQVSISKQILDSKTSKLLEKTIKQVVDEIRQNNPYGMSRLMDYFCSMESLKDQFFNFPSVMPAVVSVLNEIISNREYLDREIFIKLLELIEHFVFRYNYNIQLSGYDANSPMYSQAYTIKEINLLIENSKTVDIIISLLDILKSGDILITQNLPKIIQRLWNVCPEYRSNLFDLTISILKEVATGGTEEAKYTGSYFLSSILGAKDTPPEFKERLESEGIIMDLLQIEVKSDEIFELGDPIDIDNVQITAGFPLCAIIPSGGEYTHLIEVLESNCILCWGFATEQYDVSFKLERVDLPEVETVISIFKIRCDETPASGVRLLSSSGTYKFTWSNSYSWFRTKHLRYKIYVLRPYKFNSISGPKDLSQIITIFDEDPASSAKILENPNFLEVGVQIKDKILRLSALDPNCKTSNYILEEVSFSSQSEIVLSISGFIDELSSETKINSVKIGIVMAEPEHIQGLEKLGSIAIARDVHALGLLSQDYLHAHTIITVIYEDGIRSSVVYRGKLLIGEDGNSLGDLKSMGEINVIQGIGILLCMFGPAVVILAGDKFEGSLPTLVANIKKHVSPEIWKKSVIRESAFKIGAIAQAGSKLHYLHYKLRKGSIG